MALRGGRLQWWRWLGAALLLLLGLHAVRVAYVRAASPEERPRALALWPSHPDLLFETALAGIGAAAARGERPDPALLDMIDRGARRAPLAPEPFWVEATLRLESGDLASARELLKAAVRRDPRAPAGRFLLADVAVREGRLGEAIEELAALQRRLPGVAEGFAPALVRTLRQPGGLQRIGPLLARRPELREPVLAALATDRRDLPLLLALSRPGDQRQPWYRVAVERLVEGGDVAGLRRLQSRLMPGEDPGGSLTRWQALTPASPFGWRFPAGSGGLAEPVTNGPLRLVYYGREESTLAEHLLALAPGRYRLADRFNGQPPSGSFEWRLVCASGNRLLAAAPAGEARGERLLAVPANCPLQRLLLFARPGDISRTVRTELAELSLTPAGEES
jgi:hypothetical protein